MAVQRPVAGAVAARHVLLGGRQHVAARVRALAPDDVDAVSDQRGDASVDRSYRLLNRTGTLVVYCIAAKLDDSSPIIVDFLRLLTKLAVWNYLPTQKHACFYNVWARHGKPDSAKREAFRTRMRTNLTHVLNLLRDGTLTAQIAASFPPAEAATALELSESSNRTALGKIILLP
ncbi:MAG TPA: zinc-binding dehydrogenase [Actinospica sp.]|nr:zinc-binding dehydrogenase [Actinospica sp.]